MENTVKKSLLATVAAAAAVSAGAVSVSADDATTSSTPVATADQTATATDESTDASGVFSNAKDHSDAVTVGTATDSEGNDLSKKPLEVGSKQDINLTIDAQQSGMDFSIGGGFIHDDSAYYIAIPDALADKVSITDGATLQGELSTDDTSLVGGAINFLSAATKWVSKTSIDVSAATGNLLLSLGGEKYQVEGMENFDAVMNKWLAKLTSGEMNTFTGKVPFKASVETINGHQAIKLDMNNSLTSAQIVGANWQTMLGEITQAYRNIKLVPQTMSGQAAIDNGLTDIPSLVFDALNWVSIQGMTFESWIKRTLTAVEGDLFDVTSNVHFKLTAPLTVDLTDAKAGTYLFGQQILSTDNFGKLVGKNFSFTTDATVLVGKDSKRTITFKNNTSKDITLASGAVVKAKSSYTVSEMNSVLGLTDDSADADVIAAVAKEFQLDADVWNLNVQADAVYAEADATYTEADADVDDNGDVIIPTNDSSSSESSTSNTDGNGSAALPATGSANEAGLAVAGMAAAATTLGFAVRRKF